ncbi:uncharacterized protein LOC136078177 [Hydra vulgaris]|uniref:Uncharacterized protein LOC136078177 n=1 Tax=Hydra vulgaris TaxID=6087 RepID=A0ABM4BJZ0_HYDVU
MPGATCSITNCGTSRRTKGIGIFKLPYSNPADPAHQNWRSEWLNSITKGRVIDQQFKEQINSGKIYACEKHFKPDDFETHIGLKMTKKIMKNGAISTLLLPTKSCNLTSPKQRMPRKIILSETKEPIKYYNKLNDISIRIPKLKLLNGWITDVKEKEISILKNVSNQFVLPEFEITIDESLGYSLAVYGCMVPECHPIYSDYKRSMQNITVTNLIHVLESYQLCIGVPNHEKAASTIHHCIPFKINPHSWDTKSSPFNHMSYYRNINCDVLLKNSNRCKKCLLTNKSIIYSQIKKVKRHNEPAKLNAAISLTTPSRLKLTMQLHRLKCAQLQARIEAMKEELISSSVMMDCDLHSDFLSIISNTNHNISDFMNLFWQEQKKLFSVSPSEVRYHPMIIRYCLSIASKSPSAYQEIRDSKVLVLPSLRTLRDYKNCITPKAGFQEGIVAELCMQAEQYTKIERYIVLLIDEMSLKSNLVFDKNSHQLSGFVDLGDPDLNFATLQKCELATHALVFMVRGIAASLKFSIAYFTTITATAVQLFSLFWDSVCILEKRCNLYQVSVVADGASSNRTMIKFHHYMCGDMITPVIFKTINLYVKYRYIYFVADPPHLMKTARNCLLNSGAGKCTRYLWNNGKYLLWQHITQFYYEDFDNGLKLMPKLTNEHIHINSYSAMTVKLATQILSQTVASVLKTFGTEEHKETASFCEKMDMFFDCVNNKSLEEHKINIKPFLQKYTDQNDLRFNFLLNDFLDYFKDWKRSINERVDNTSSCQYSYEAKAKMFISHQTHEGLIMTCNSIVEVTRFLLAEGMSYVLTNRFCQDPLEKYFSAQRQIGRHSDNPDAKQFGYNSNAIRIQRSVSLNTGNTRGSYIKKKSLINVSEDLIPKRKRKKT